MFSYTGIRVRDVSRCRPVGALSVSELMGPVRRYPQCSTRGHFTVKPFGVDKSSVPYTRTKLTVHGVLVGATQSIWKPLVPLIRVLGSSFQVC